MYRASRLLLVAATAAGCVYPSLKMGTGGTDAAGGTTAAGDGAAGTSEGASGGGGGSGGGGDAGVPDSLGAQPDVPVGGAGGGGGAVGGGGTGGDMGGGATTGSGFGGAGGATSSGGATSTGGTTSAGGTTGIGSTTSVGGTTSAGGSTAAGGSGGSPPATGGGGAPPATGGTTPPGSCPTFVDGPTPDATTRANCTGSGSAGISCHFGGDPGNYDVSFYLGGDAAGQTIVQAEHLREMLAAPFSAVGDAVAPIVNAAGQKLRYSMSVNVRQPEGQPEWSQASNGTPGLDVYFVGPSPQLDSIAYAPAAASDIVTYILTDSTGCDQEGPGTAGWGQWLPQLFGNGISVANYGNSGALSECSATTTPCRTEAPYYSFYDDPKMWPTVKPLLKAGDVVLIEFALNDKNTPQDQFEANLLKYITETKAAGAIPILATPIPRCNFTGNTMNSDQLVNSVGVDLPASIRSVGATNNVPVIEITKTAVAFFSTVGASSCQKYWADGMTQLNTVGANVVAEMIRDQIKSLNIYPLVCYLR